jgi:two-component system chemotaxis response regulator CheY
MLDPAELRDASRQGSGGDDVMRLSQSRLLVIEADTLNRMMICRVAARAGYAPAGASTYDEAVHRLQETQYDCITLDLSLGAHDGTEVLRHLADIGCTAHIIVISGRDDVARHDCVKAAKSLHLNVWDSIPKPVDLVVLRYWLERLKSEYVPATAAA